MSNYKLVADENGPLTEKHIRGALHSLAFHAEISAEVFKQERRDAVTAFQSALAAAQSPTPPPSPVALVEALRPYLRHHHQCASRAYNFPPDGKTQGPCNCGLDKSLAHLGETGRKG